MKEKDLREIKALITLLGDDDLKIRNVAWERLLAHGEPAHQLIKEVAFSDSEGRIRIEAQALLEEIRLDNLAKHFKKIIQSSDFDLEQACFILAQIEYPNLNISHYIEKIEYLAHEAQIRILGIQEEKKQVKNINHFLFYEQGFRGNVDAYFDPENSYINKVLDRYLGIPISLSAIYLFIARRLNLPIFGVGFPGHFLLKYKRDSDLFYIDAFNHGKILTRHDCERFLNRMGYEFYDSYLDISTPKEMLARMIRNLVLIYHQSNQLKKIDTLEKIFSDFFMH
ncbi:MAG: transglutaminase family protein [bacterium]